MATFCIPPILAEKLKAAAQRGEIDIEKMYDMNSAERKAVFENYVDLETARQINLGFEKAMVSKKVDALGKWAQNTFIGKDKETRKRTITQKIQDMSEAGVLTPEREKAFYEDLISEQLGLTVTPEEASQINKLSNELQKADAESEFGTPSMEYFQKRREMQDYIDSLTPSSSLKVFTSIIGRGNMLMRASSPLLNIESNTVMGAVQALARRLETRKIGGVNNSYALRYQKFALDVYMKTGYDITRMMAIDDDLTVRGEDITTSQGKGTVRKIGRFYEDVVFKGMQGTPDVLYAGFASADRANIESTKLARQEGLKGKEAQQRALEIFKDATRIDPQTTAGKQVRQSAVADAMYTTYTNKSIYSDVALGIRNVFNIASGDARLGDQIMPFVKTPANVIGSGLNLSGIGVPVDATYRMMKVLGDIKSGTKFTEAVQQEYAGFWRTLVEAGIGITFAHILTSLFKPEDFIGEYPVSEKERQLLALKNAVTNSVKIGNRWVSTDYFGSLGAPITGMMYAKKYGNNIPSGLYEYVKGVLAQTAKLPGFENMTDIIDYLNSVKNVNRKTVNDELRDLASYAVGFGVSRTIPGIVYDIAKILDYTERKSDKNDIFNRLKMALPGIRETLPEKRTVYGETINTEPDWSTLLFGSRIKTANDIPLIQELVRLDGTGNLPSITDVSKTSSRAKELKTQIGDEKFDQFMVEFGQTLLTKSNKLIENRKYTKLSDEDRKKELDSLKDDVFESMLKKYKYKKPKK